MATTFKPSVNGFKFINSWPHEPDIIVNVAGLGNVAIGDASNGLCGGMAFSACDFFQAKLPIIGDSANPAQGSPLFNYMVARLFDSFNLPGGVLKYYEWMNTPDHDTGLLFAVRRGVAWMTIMDELPKIKADIDSGKPSPLGLVTVYTTDPTMIGHNHQVLAYAYEQDGAGNLKLHVYDPNSGTNDGVFMALNLNNPSHTTAISHNVNIGLPVRGFFRVGYGAHDSSKLEPPPPARPPAPVLNVTVNPSSVPLMRPVTLTVSAQDSASKATVNGNVLIEGRSVGTIGHPFTYTFVQRTIRGGRRYPIGVVSAEGYALTPIHFGFPAL